MNQSLVINPHDGKEYDFAPLFQFLKDEKTSMSELAQRCKSAGDAIPQFYDVENVAYFRDMKDSIFILNNLRDIFSKME